MLEVTKKTSALSLLFCFILTITSSCSNQTYQTSRTKPHWVSWSRGKIFKTKRHPSKNLSLEKEVSYLFVIESEGNMPIYHKSDVEDLVRLKASSYYAGLIKSNIEEFLIHEKNISDSEREVFLHKTNTLNYSIDISGLLPIAKYWEYVKEDGVKKNKVYFLYSVSQKRLYENINSVSNKIKLYDDLKKQLINQQNHLEEKKYHN